MMHGHEKSDPAIVAMKPANKAEDSVVERSVAEPNAAEPVERRAGTKGNAGQQSTRRTQSRVSVSHALERIRQNRNEKRSAVTHPRWEPYARIGPVRICAGGRSVMSVPTAISETSAQIIPLKARADSQDPS